MANSKTAAPVEHERSPDDNPDSMEAFGDIERSESMMELILQDPETASIVSHMMRSSRRTLKSSPHHRTIYNKLDRKIKKEKYFDNVTGNRFREGLLHFTINDFVTCSATEIDDEGPIVHYDSMADMWVKEVVKFIALKIIIDNDDKNSEEEKGSNTDSRDESDTALKENKMTGSTIHKRLLPSKAIHDAWKVIISHPKLYSEICEAMGSNIVVDLNIDNNKYEVGEKYFSSKLDKKMWDYECYNWTLNCYEILFREKPSEIFWPPMKLNDESTVKNVGMRLAEFIATFAPEI